MIKCKNLNMEFQKKVLNNINFEIKKGEIYGLVGPNGAGKTTLIKILIGLIKPTSYDILEILNKNVDDKKLKGEIGIVLNIEQLYNELNAYENIKFFQSLYKIKSNKNEIIKLLKEVGLENDVYKDVINYSYGMKQKLNIATSLAINSKILIMDEPTNGLDPKSIREFYNLILKLQERGMTFLISSHNMNEIEEVCSHVLMLNEGKLLLNDKLINIYEKYNDKIYSFITEMNIDDIEKIMKNYNYYLKKDGIYMNVICFEKIDIDEYFEKLQAKEMGIHKIKMEDVFLYELNK